MDASKPEPAPEPNDTQPIYELVMADIEARAKTGREKYGTYLQAGNGRNALMDAYQEALDLAMYLRQRLAEEGGAPPKPSWTCPGHLRGELLLDIKPKPEPLTTETLHQWIERVRQELEVVAWRTPREPMPLNPSAYSLGVDPGQPAGSLQRTFIVAVDPRTLDVRILDDTPKGGAK